MHSDYEIYDDIWLSKLINSASEKPVRPWWHWFLIFSGIGLAVLVPIAWCVR